MDKPEEQQQKTADDEEVAILFAKNTSPATIIPSSSSHSNHPDNRNDSGGGGYDGELPPGLNLPSPDDDDEEFYSSSSSSERFSCTQFIFKRLPILKWLPKYRPRTDLLPDVVSGVTVGLTAIPQSMAYAGVAGLTPEFGLYSSFISCFVYLFLGSCRQMTIGPTALMELLVFETCGQDFPSCVILVGFWVGCIQFLMGLLKLGAVVSLISDPVTIGFVGGASLTICSSQIKSFLGLSGPKGSGFLGYVKSAIENISSAKLGDSLLGLGCAAILILFKNLKDCVKPDTTTTSGRFLAKLIWFLSIGRNAMVVIIASILAASLSDPPFALTGAVKSGFPPVGPPTFELLDEFNPEPISNSTATPPTTLTFWETWSELGTAPLMIALISILQNVAIAKAFGSGQSIDATQEMIALGVSHVVASFFSALPTAGSFTRSAVNEASGVKSPIGGIFTGLLVIFALSFLTRWFAYIPKASLAAVILCAVLPMIEYEAILPMWKISKLDVLTTLVTFLASLLLGMEYGIIIGVATSLIIYLAGPVRPRVFWRLEKVTKSSIPNDDADDLAAKDGRMSGSREQLSMEESSADQYHFIRPQQGFQFPSVDSIRTFVNKLALRYPYVKVICLDCGKMIEMDYTSASALSSLIKALRKTGKELVLMRCKREWVDMLAVVMLKKVECFENVGDVERWIVARNQGQGGQDGNASIP